MLESAAGRASAGRWLESQEGKSFTMSKALSFMLALLLLAGCGGAPAPANSAPQAAATGQARSGSLQISSPAFSEGEMIPARHTCDAENVSPPLQWAGVPPGAETLALIVDDPDAPLGTWVHWVVFNLPATTTGLPEGVAAPAMLENGAAQGVTSFRTAGYGGPCPPSGTHRYYFKLYALDTRLSLGGDASAAGLQKAMEEHVLAEAALMGRYRH